jgi:hypothetical protein
MSEGEPEDSGLTRVQRYARTPRPASPFSLEARRRAFQGVFGHHQVENPYGEEDADLGNVSQDPENNVPAEPRDIPDMQPEEQIYLSDPLLRDPVSDLNPDIIDQKESQTS